MNENRSEKTKQVIASPSQTMEEQAAFFVKGQQSVHTGF